MVVIVVIIVPHSSNPCKSELQTLQSQIQTLSAATKAPYNDSVVGYTFATR